MKQKRALPFLAIAYLLLFVHGVVPHHHHSELQESCLVELLQVHSHQACQVLEAESQNERDHSVCTLTDIFSLNSLSLAFAPTELTIHQVPSLPARTYLFRCISVLHPAPIFWTQALRAPPVC